MGIDIGRALREGASRTAAKNGLILAAVFAGIALLTTVLVQSLTVAVSEAILQTFQNASPEELGLAQAEYEQLIAELERNLGNVEETSPLALPIPAAAAGAGALALAVVSEAVSIVAVRIFATDPEAVSRDLVTDRIVRATLNGFVGGIVVWVLIGLGFALLVIPGIVLAVLFYFLRQEIAINDKNFVQAMADSWRITKGSRIEVFLIALVIVLVARLEGVSSIAVGTVSIPAATVVAAGIGGILTVFGAAATTRAYVQLDSGSAAEPTEPDDPEPPEDDPYDAALGPDDLTR